MTRDSLFRRILVPTDGSELAIEAARYAAEIAGWADAEVTVVHALQVVGVTQFVAEAAWASENFAEEMRETGETIIATTKTPLLKANVRTHSKIIEGHAAEVILQEAEAGDYHLIVMGSRGAGTDLLRRIVFGLGSVAERVIANAPCPVLVVRSRK